MSSSTIIGKIKNKIKAHEKMISKFLAVDRDVFIRMTAKGDKYYSKKDKDDAIKEHLQYTAESIKNLISRRL